jgi:hypothetical protein
MAALRRESQRAGRARAEDSAKSIGCFQVVGGGGGGGLTRIRTDSAGSDGGPRRLAAAEPREPPRSSPSLPSSFLARRLACISVSAY